MTLSTLVRHLLSALVSDKIAFALQEEMGSKCTRHQKRLLKSHGENFYLASDVIIHGPGMFACGNSASSKKYAPTIHRLLASQKRVYK